MAPSKPSARSGDDDDNRKLILYRLDLVERAIKDVGEKVDRQDNIKRSDLLDFKETIKNLVLDIRTDLQKQIDAKAESQELKDLKKQFYAVMAFLSTLNGAVLVAFFTRR